MKNKEGELSVKILWYNSIGLFIVSCVIDNSTIIILISVFLILLISNDSPLTIVFVFQRHSVLLDLFSWVIHDFLESFFILLHHLLSLELLLHPVIRHIARLLRLFN